MKTTKIKDVLSLLSQYAIWTLIHGMLSFVSLKQFSAWLETEEPRVRASPALLRCGPWARHIYLSLVLVQPQEDRSLFNWKIVDGT